MPRASGLSHCVQPLTTLQGLNHLFVQNSSAAITFQLDLTRLINVLEPIAKSLTCLESTHSTLADVYIYWLAASAELQQIFTSSDRGGFDKDTIERIIGISNFRFNQMINDAPEDAYITSFVLDPRKYIIELVRNSCNCNMQSSH